jgi:hypothetical protein
VSSDRDSVAAKAEATVRLDLATSVVESKLVGEVLVEIKAVLLLCSSKETGILVARVLPPSVLLSFS